MSIADLGSLGEFISSFAVLFTLVYLSLQMRQSNKLAVARTREHMATLTIEELHKYSDNPEEMMVFMLDEELTKTQKVRVHFMLTAMMRRQEFDWWQYQHGLLDTESYQTSQLHLNETFQIENMRQWWRLFGRNGNYNSAFVREIDELAEKAASNTNQSYSQRDVWDQWTAQETS